MHSRHRRARRANGGRTRGGLREPVHTAIDITTWNFWPSPFKDERDVEWWEEPVVLNGRERYPKDDYPEMVSGLKDRHERGYKFATLTIIAEETPIVLAIEPVRDRRRWEDDDVETTSRTGLVDRLLEQAKQHVEINKVFADREFDGIEIRDIIDQHELLYIIGKRKNAKVDFENIESVKEHLEDDVAVESAELTAKNGRTHELSIMYIPSDSDEESAIVVLRDWGDDV